ncbi:MAG: phosphoribosylanthranilate isomerase [Eubacteriales bacterium]|nr:phosphoribosylanthranilate isomerase [Eubacteriales bacterium]
MTKIKLCGLSRPADIEAVNALRPDYIGFVFAPGSKRYVTPAQASALKSLLAPGIRAAGVFVNEDIEVIAGLVRDQIIDVVQLHGNEDRTYLRTLRGRIQNSGFPGHPSPEPLILQAFRIRSSKDVTAARSSGADLVLLDAGAGDGRIFDWTLLEDFQRPFFLAGGLTPGNAADAVRALHPYGLDVSSGIETDGRKDPAKMTAFVRAVRTADRME